MKSLLFVLVFIVSCFAQDIEGFRDMKWGDSPDKLGKSSVEQSNKLEKTEYRVKTNENLKIGETDLEKIGYGFFDNKLFAVIIRFKGESNFTSILTAYESKYGAFPKINKFDDYNFGKLFGNGFVSITINRFSKDGTVSMMDNAISKERKEYAKSVQGKGAKDL